MPENPETKPEEAKQGEKPSEKPQEHVEQAKEAKAPRKYVDYDSVSPQEAAVMLKRIRARVKRIERDIDAIMAILKYGANAGTPQGQNQGGGGQYQRQYQRQGGYRRNYYNRYGGRRYSQHRRNEEDVNYE
jgi:hypothetical protein